MRLMAEATAETPQAQATTSQPAEAPAPNWREEVEKQWFGLQLGERAFMLDKWQRQQEIVFDSVKAASDGTLGGTSPEGDAMGVSVGNTVNHYYQQSTATDNSSAASPPSPTAPAPATAIPPIAAAAGLVLPGWAKIAAIVGGAALAGGGGSVIGNWLTKPTVNISAPVLDDTNAGLRFKE